MKYAAKILLAFILVGLCVYPFLDSRALTEETVVTGTIDYSSYSELPMDQIPDLSEYISDFVDVPEGGVQWGLFTETESIEYQDKDEEGRDIFGVKPEFSEELKKLDGQMVLMQGYMFPLESEEAQSLFLFGPFPVSCPFHYHVGPDLIIEARSKDNIKFEWDAINIRGRLELVPRDDDFNIFYRLHEVELVK